MQSSNPVRLFPGVASEIYGQSGTILSLGYPETKGEAESQEGHFNDPWQTAIQSEAST